MLWSRSLFAGVYLTLTLAVEYPFQDPTLPWDVRTDDLLGRLHTDEIVSYWSCHDVNTLRPKQNDRHFLDDNFKLISLNENAYISIKISLKFVPIGPINNIPPLLQFR